MPDVVVGAPRGGIFTQDPGGDGLVQIRSGADGSLIRTLSCFGGCLGTYAGNFGAGDLFGTRVAIAGDLDLDGHAEVMVAHKAMDCVYVYPGDFLCSNQPAGVKVYAGSDGALMFDYAQVGGTPSMGAVGDVDADGFPDFAIAGSNQSFGAVVYSGVDGSVLRSFSVGNNAQSILSVAGAGDINGDGHADLVIGAPGQASAWGETGGSVFVLSGLNGKLLGQHFLPNSTLGYSVAGGGDHNGDGALDVLAASPYYGSYSVGQVKVLKLSP